MLRPILACLSLSITISVSMDLPLVPLPSEVHQADGRLILSGSIRFQSDDSKSPASARAMITEAIQSAGFSKEAAGPVIPITFLHRQAANESDEAYQLTISGEGITIHGSEAGLYRGATTLSQLIALTPKADGKIALPFLEIKDSPRFGWRGFMLDESRSFAGEEEVMRLLDTMAFYKLNRFHWHLTDSPAWRIEIKAYPKLTEVGARGCETDPDGKGEPRFYSREEIRRIVRYAKERFITVIPEIDLPGHADAAVRSYPELDGGGYQVKGHPGKWPRFTLNPGSPKVHAFRDQVFAELAELFPDAGVLHGGGDEVDFGWSKWPALPEVRDLMARENLADNAAVEKWFGRGMGAKINQLGFKTGMWDGTTAMDLAPEKSVLFWWRHDKPNVLHQALKRGYPVVLCPRRPLYFDFIQSDGHKSGRTWQGFNPLRDVYDFPGSLKLPTSPRPDILGIQACLWTENAQTRKRREFLTWPRLIAVAESAWTPVSGKDFPSFSRRLQSHLPWLKKRGITPFDPFANSPEVVDSIADQ